MRPCTSVPVLVSDSPLASTPAEVVVERLLKAAEEEHCCRMEVEAALVSTAARMKTSLPGVAEAPGHIHFDCSLAADILHSHNPVVAEVAGPVAARAGHLRQGAHSCRSHRGVGLAAAAAVVAMVGEKRLGRTPLGLDGHAAREQRCRRQELVYPTDSSALPRKQLDHIRPDRLRDSRRDPRLMDCQTILA